MPKRFSRADLHKLLNQHPDVNDVLRNHAFSKVGRGGEARGMSIERRRDMDLKRKTIAAYRSSKIGGLHDRPHIPRIMPENSQETDSSISEDEVVGNRQNGGIHEKGKIDKKSLERRHHFIEPPRRRYDKYG